MLAPVPLKRRNRKYKTERRRLINPQTLNISVPEDMLDWLRDTAGKQKISISALIRQFVTKEMAANGVE